MPSTVIGVSDLHCGSQYALCPPEVPLDNGGFYRPNAVQEQLWQWWGDFFGRAATVAEKNGGPVYLVVNGELIEGSHHGTSQVLSVNPADQARCARRVMEPALAVADKLFVVRGTDAHSGESGRNDERLACELGAVQNPATDLYSWYELNQEIEGVRLNWMHHAWGATRPWTRGGNALRMAAALVYNYCDDPENRPHLAVRSHVHRWADSYDQHPVRVIVTGPWKASDGYGAKVSIAGGRVVFGGIIVTCDDGRYDVEKVQYTPDRGPTWKA